MKFVSLYSIPFFSFFLLLLSHEPYFCTTDDGIIGYFLDFFENRWVDATISRLIITLGSIIFLSIFSCLYFKNFRLGFRTIGIVASIHPFFSFLVMIQILICNNQYGRIRSGYPFLFLGVFWTIEMLIGYIVCRCTMDIMKIFNHSKSVDSNISIKLKRNLISRYYDT